MGAPAENIERIKAQKKFVAREGEINRKIQKGINFLETEDQRKDETFKR